MTDIVSPGVAAEPSARAGLYRAIWRWHFYAGLFVLPFMIILATTGALYLFDDELNAVIYHEEMTVAQTKAMPLAHQSVVRAALAVVPDGKATGYFPPASPTVAAKVGVRSAGGELLYIYVNPYDGAVQGIIPREGLVMRIIRKIHSLAYFGTLANYVIELAACWAIMLAVTGIYLWWPRGASGGVVTVRATPTKRVFWRDLHAVIGLFVAGFIVFLAITGLPWSVWWGENVKELASEAGIGYPAMLWDDVPTSTIPAKDVMASTAWSTENSPMPISTDTGVTPISLDKAVAIFNERGIKPGYGIDLPGGPEGVYSASIYPHNLAEQRMIHMDQYSGAVLVDLSYADYPGFAKAMEWGINVHMGQEYGWANKIILALACLGMVALSVSAAIMWWKRRPAGRLGAPRIPENYKVARWALAIALVLCLVFPLMGISLVVFLIVDFLLPKGLRKVLA